MAFAVFQGSSNYPGPASGRPGPVVTIGNFDGVHLGHQALLARVLERARATGATACVYTFHPAPRDVLRPDNGIPRIQNLEDKLASLEAFGVDQVVVEAFDLELAAREPRWFADEVLTARLRASAVIVGWDFRFGRKRAGTVEDLRAWCAVPVEQVEARALDGEVVSSSRIRALIHEGDVAGAARLLTRPYRVRGVVGPGDQRGRTIGFPTANVVIENPLWPANGVYAVRAEVDGALHPAVANLGVRPTFGGGPPLLEVHLLDFAGDLYGRRLAVDFVARVREERKFSGIEALVAQIRRDADEARALLR